LPDCGALEHAAGKTAGSAVAGEDMAGIDMAGIDMATRARVRRGVCMVGGDEGLEGGAIWVLF
jgi:hypothetical protein